MAGRATVNYSILVKREGERLLECLQDSNLGIISCSGWDGIGRWRVAEYATSIAMESHLFDVLIWVNLPRNEWTSCWKLQKRIAESLGIESPTIDVEDSQVESKTDIRIAVQIYEKLKATKFLLVVGGTSSECQHTDLGRMGVPNLRRRSSSVSKVLSLSKVVLIGKWNKIKVDKDLSSEVHFAIGTSIASDSWDLICEEAALATHSPSIRGYFSPNTVIDCLLYFSLSFHDKKLFDYDFASHKEWMIRYWIAEEFIGGEMKKEGVSSEMVDALLAELEDRSIVPWGSTGFTKHRMQYIVMLGMLGRIPNFSYRYWIHSNSLPKEDEERTWGSIQRMSVLITGTERINLPLSPKCPSLSTLILRYDSIHHLEFPVNFFDRMENLRVLDLACTPLRTLPSSLSSLCNLKLLMLQSCRKLESLPTSLKSLKTLEFLDLSYCDSLKMIPEESFELMDRLRILDLSKMQINSLPSSIFNLCNLQELLLCSCSELTHIQEKCFERMSHLHVLDLSSATSLKSLPSSLSNLVNLKKLNLSKCTSLKTGLPPQSLQNLSSLEVLDLDECDELEDIRDFSFQHVLPKLRRVRISSTRTPYRLSFRARQSIEIIDLNDLPKLEVLDLSGTKLKTFRLTASTGCSLKRLDVLPTRYSDILFQMINWLDDDVGARIWVMNPDFFQSTFHISKRVFEAPCFSQFYIRISPYEEEGCMPITLEKIQNIHLQRNPVVYRGIYFSHIQKHIFPYFTSACGKQLEVCGGNSSPRGVDELLTHTELITLLFNNFIKRLSDLCNAAELRGLKECRIGCCQRIENIFFEDNPSSDVLRSLEVIWASDLPQLTAVCGGVYGEKSFELLKHIYLEHCPKLSTLFASGVYLQSLQTLEIRFCCRLENVFDEEASSEKRLLQSLRSLFLLHVPKLKSVCNGSLPQLEKVKVLGCPKLRNLPIQVHLVASDTSGSATASSSLPVIEIRGEIEWWKNLQWGDEDNSNKRPARFRQWRTASTTMRRR